jgi:hypothetical protein
MTLHNTENKSPVRAFCADLRSAVFFTTGSVYFTHLHEL